jgi:hypothetical protein
MMQSGIAKADANNSAPTVSVTGLNFCSAFAVASGTPKTSVRNSVNRLASSTLSGRAEDF